MRPTKRKLGVMPLTCVVALLGTLGMGLFSEAHGDRDAAAQERERSHEAVVRAELGALGFAPPASAALRDVTARLSASHGVEVLHARREVELDLDNGIVTASPADERALAAATVLLVDELSLLPSELLQRSGLARVLMVSDLAEERRTIPSLPNFKKSLIVDVGASPSFLRRLLHHEVFHFIDLADDGEVLCDRDWEALNPPGFHYGPGGRTMRERDSSALSREVPGFVTRYATSALEEDKAEVFAFLVTEPARVRSMAQGDACLAAKIEQLETLVADVTNEADHDFWHRVEQARQ